MNCSFKTQVSYVQSANINYTRGDLHWIFCLIIILLMRPRWLVQDCISPNCRCSLCIQQNTTSFALGELFITKFRGPGTLKEIIPGFLIYLLRKTNFLRTLLLDRQAMLCYSYVQIIKVSDHIHNYYAYNQGPLNFS